MTDNRDNLLQTIPRLFALCATIREAAAHGAAEPDAAAAMKEDVAAGIRAAEEAARKLCPAEPPAPASLDDLAAAQGERISEFANSWFSNTMGPFLLQHFQKTLHSAWKLSQQDAQNLAHWVLRELPALPATKKEPVAGDRVALCRQCPGIFLESDDAGGGLPHAGGAKEKVSSLGW